MKFDPLQSSCTEQIVFSMNSLRTFTIYLRKITFSPPSVEAREVRLVSVRTFIVQKKCGHLSE
jgi:hypothetical protein